MSYYGSNNDGCLVLLAIPIFLAWNILKGALAICACALVIPIRIIWLFVTIPINIFTGEDHTADWADEDFMSNMWHIFFPSR